MLVGAFSYDADGGKLGIIFLKEDLKICIRDHRQSHTILIIPFLVTDAKIK